jgi:hypothetical protein
VKTPTTTLLTYLANSVLIAALQMLRESSRVTNARQPYPSVRWLPGKPATAVPVERVAAGQTRSYPLRTITLLRRQAPEKVFWVCFNIFSIIFIK